MVTWYSSSFGSSITFFRPSTKTISFTCFTVSYYVRVLKRSRSSIAQPMAIVIKSVKNDRHEATGLGFPALLARGILSRATVSL